MHVIYVNMLYKVCLILIYNVCAILYFYSLKPFLVINEGGPALPPMMLWYARILLWSLVNTSGTVCPVQCTPHPSVHVRTVFLGVSMGVHYVCEGEVTVLG